MLYGLQSKTKTMAAVCTVERLSLEEQLIPEVIVISDEVQGKAE